MRRQAMLLNPHIYKHVWQMGGVARRRLAGAEDGIGAARGWVGSLGAGYGWAEAPDYKSAF